MSQFRFKSKNAVAIGSFNIYIIQPQSLAQMGVLEKDASDKVLVSGDLTRPGIRFEIAGSVWVVRPDRLSVESENYRANCGELLQKTLQALCWTPIVALGANVTFSAPIEIERQLAFKLPEHRGALQRTSHVAVELGESVVNIQLGQVKDELELRVNVHTDLNDLRGDSRKISEKAVAVMGQYDQHISDALETASEILNPQE